MNRLSHVNRVNRTARNGSQKKQIYPKTHSFKKQKRKLKKATTQNTNLHYRTSDIQNVTINNNYRTRRMKKKKQKTNKKKQKNIKQKNKNNKKKKKKKKKTKTKKKIKKK